MLWIYRAMPFYGKIQSKSKSKNERLNNEQESREQRGSNCLEDIIGRKKYIDNNDPCKERQRTGRKKHFVHPPIVFFQRCRIVHTCDI